LSLLRRPLLGLGGAALITPARAQGPSLRELARARAMSFGTAVRGQVLQDDPALAALVAREADLLVPEWEGKWDSLQPERGRFDFAPLRVVTRFAQANAQRVRGHALLWHVAMPPWLAPAIGITFCTASMPSAMGRSYIGPSLRWSAGARLISTRPFGGTYPLLISAALTRSPDSFTAASGRPTTTTFDSCCVSSVSTSTSQGTASMP
jgi:hypothetical protein